MEWSKVSTVFLHYVTLRYVNLKHPLEISILVLINLLKFKKKSRNLNKPRIFLMKNLKKLEKNLNKIEKKTEKEIEKRL